MTPIERARSVVAGWDEELRRELPESAYLFDVHTHLGHDIDGMVGDYDEITGVLDRYGFSGAFMFCLDEADREPAFTVPNDRTLADAERSDGRLSRSYASTSRRSRSRRRHAASISARVASSSTLVRRPSP